MDTRDLSSFFDKDTIYRFWVYKKMFTPYEIENKFSDESIYEDSYCNYAKILDCIPLTGGDFMANNEFFTMYTLCNESLDTSQKCEMYENFEDAKSDFYTFSSFSPYKYIAELEVDKGDLSQNVVKYLYPGEDF